MSFVRDDHAGRDFFAVLVHTDNYGFELTDDFFAFLAVLQPLNLDDDRVVILPLDRKLGIESSDQGRMSAHPRIVMSAMMHNDDGAFKRLTDPVGGLDVGCHIFIAA